MPFRNKKRITFRICVAIFACLVCGYFSFTCSNPQNINSRLAERIMAKTGITRGVCSVIGSKSGDLAADIARPGQQSGFERHGSQSAVYDAMACRPIVYPDAVDHDHSGGENLYRNGTYRPQQA